MNYFKADSGHKKEIRHSEEIQDIITAVPSWLLKWGISIFFFMLLCIFILSSIISYPDIVYAQLKIVSQNSPKPILSKIDGKLVKLLITENQIVHEGQPLAFMESTANHESVLGLLKQLQKLQNQIFSDKSLAGFNFSVPDNVNYGELQPVYQTFYQNYTEFKSTINDGFMLKKKEYLTKELGSISAQQKQLEDHKNLETKDLILANAEYEMHEKLAKQGVETNAELRQQESKLLSKKMPLVDAQSAIINNNTDFTAKQNEILELDNDIQQEKGKFLQALNSLISAADDWKNKYILTASQSGKVIFSGVIQENQVLNINEEVFDINPGNESFFGEMSIPENSLGKVHEGQKVLIKLKSYPFEEYGIMIGHIQYISDIPYKDSSFISKVKFNTSLIKNKQAINLKQGMTANAEIITQEATITQRIGRSLIHAINNK